ncbi:hypothetical protein GF412_02855 [Candidatus Micrarchaeota archaeon]|nr:hypothetical protein [Candidatus Micrarchaeota archaeon]MBD3417895.1 hypothetical protein [Candidatus Micrarchaeota archaeon]
MLQQKKQEEQETKRAVIQFPSETEAVPPFHHEHYEELHSKHKEQTVFTYIPSIRDGFNGEQEDFDRLPQEQRFQLYEMIMLGRVKSVWDELDKLKTRKKVEKKIKRSSSKKLNEILDMLDANPNLRAEDLIHVLPKKVFSKLMLYVKYAGNNPESIRKFFENMEK